MFPTLSFYPEYFPYTVVLNPEDLQHEVKLVLGVAAYGLLPLHTGATLFRLNKWRIWQQKGLIVEIASIYFSIFRPAIFTRQLFSHMPIQSVHVLVYKYKH